MIEITKLNGSKITVNADLIETVEETPDTLISLTSGKKYMVQESCKEVRALVIEYKRQIFTIEK